MAAKSRFGDQAMSRVILITGGASSGKSQFAVDMAKGFGDRIAFIATCLANGDGEMRQKIEAHRRLRPPHWTTYENRLDLTRILRAASGDGAIVDSLSLFVSSLLERDGDPLKAEVDEFCGQAAVTPFPVVIVTDEVGCGLVPNSKLGRQFREALGWANQRVAARADEVFLMVSGLPMKIKG